MRTIPVESEVPVEVDTYALCITLAHVFAPESILKLTTLILKVFTQAKPCFVRGGRKIHMNIE